MFEIDVKNKHILVTGGSDGIGKDIAVNLMEMGARVAVHYFKNEKAARRITSDYKDSGIFQADFNRPEDIVRLWENVLDVFGKIDTIILNAGIYAKQPHDGTIQQWEDTWRKTMTVNLESPALLTKLGIEHFEKNQGGRFVFMASRAVFRGETSEYLAYSASKGGLTSLGRSVARSFGKSNIKSFIIAPGFVKTGMAEQFIRDHGEESILNELSLNELTTPADLTPLIALMCSGALDHATGATFDINAGSHIR